MPGGTDLNRLRRAAVSASLVKAISCGAVAGWLVWLMTKPMDTLVGMVTLFVAQLWLMGGVAYLLAAFLLSRRSSAWRFSGGIIDSTVTAVVAWVFFWFAGQSFAAMNAYSPGDPGELPALIFAAIAIVWIAASIPMLAWFLLGPVARFQLRRKHA